MTYIASCVCVFVCVRTYVHACAVVIVVIVVVVVVLFGLAVELKQLKKESLHLDCFYLEYMMINAVINILVKSFQ